jgi:hypothetical protein
VDRVSKGRFKLALPLFQDLFDIVFLVINLIDARPDHFGQRSEGRTARIAAYLEGKTNQAE